MDAREYSDADVAVLGSVANAFVKDESDQKFVMSTLERYGVKSSWFRDQRYKDFFEAVVKVWRERNVLDVYTVMSAYDAPGRGDVINALIDYPATASQLDYYCQALKDKHVCASVHRLMMEQIKELRPESIGIQVEDFMKAMHDIQNEIADGDSGMRKLSDFMQSSIEKKERLHEERFVKHNWEFMDGLPFPWHEVNQIFSGLKTGLHIIGALASQGKSTLAVDLSVFWNTKGIKHGYISIDMAAEQLVDRYACVSERVSLAKLNFGGSAGDLAKFKTGFKRHAELDNVTVMEEDNAKKIEYLCFRGVKSLGWKAVIIDYIQLVTPDEKGNLPEYTKVQHAVQAVKRIAKRLKVPIVCLAQLSRAFEGQLREGKGEPGLDSLGDSAEIARAAASVTVLYQDQDMRKYWKENPPTQLAFGDKNDVAVRVGYIRAETEDEKKARRQGQLSLAKSLRPVWFEVLKNQQGGHGKIPFVMFANYFLFRPGNSEGEDVEVTVDGKNRKLPVGKFEQLRDDWIYAETDWWLEMTGALPQRGVKLLGETWEQAHERMRKEREAHPEVQHGVWSGSQFAIIPVKEKAAKESEASNA